MLHSMAAVATEARRTVGGRSRWARPSMRKKARRSVPLMESMTRAAVTTATVERAEAVTAGAVMAGAVTAAAAAAAKPTAAVTAVGAVR